MIVTTGGSLEALDGANGEQVVETMLASARAAGREEERRNTETVLKEKDQQIKTIEYEARKAERVRNETAIEAEKLRAKLSQAESERAHQVSEFAEKIRSESEMIGNAVSSTIFLSSAIVSIFGQLYFWSDRFRVEHPVLAVGIAASSLLTALYFLKFLPHLPDIHGSIGTKIAGWIKSWRLRQIYPLDLRNEVSARLDEFE